MRLQRPGRASRSAGAIGSGGGVAGPDLTALVSGGTVTTVGGYEYHTFTANGTLTVDTAGTMEVLCCGGGGGGGGYHTAGGGGGGAVLTDILDLTTGGKSVTVGIGGAGRGNSTNGVAGKNGGTSVFQTLSATGGGVGAHGWTAYNAGSAGTGGGGAHYNGGSKLIGGTGSIGGDGGTTDLATSGNAASGGGGADGDGVSANGSVQFSQGGDGGPGKEWPTGSGTYYGGGGGGGSGIDGAVAVGGIGGGGKGGDRNSSISANPPTVGTNGLGGGGGGAGAYGSQAGGPGKAGGSGAVIIRVNAPVVPSLAEAINALSPVGYWKLDETSGTTATDSSGNGHDGTYTGTLTLDATDGAPNFDGGYVSIPDHANFSANAASGMTWFALMKSDNASTGREFILSKGDAGVYEWEMSHGNVAAGRIYCTTYAPGGAALTSEYLDGAYAIGTDWVAMCWRTVSPVRSGSMGHYQNSGTLNATATSGTNFAGTYTNGVADVIIGQRADLPSGQGFDGALAHVAIFPGLVDPTTIMAAAVAAGYIA